MSERVRVWELVEEATRDCISYLYQAAKLPPAQVTEGVLAAMERTANDGLTAEHIYASSGAEVPFDQLPASEQASRRLVARMARLAVDLCRVPCGTGISRDAMQIAAAPDALVLNLLPELGAE